MHERSYFWAALNTEFYVKEEVGGSRYEKYPPKKQRESIREFFNCDNSVKLEFNNSSGRSVQQRRSSDYYT